MEALHRQLLRQKADTLNESEVAEVLEYIAVMESMSSQSTRPDPLEELMLRILTSAIRVEPSTYSPDCGFRGVMTRGARLRS